MSKPILMIIPVEREEKALTINFLLQPVTEKVSFDVVKLWLYKVISVTG